MDSKSSTPRHSFAGRLSTTTGNNQGLGSSSSSVSLRSTASRPRGCYVCEEAEQLPTKALVGCVTCKKLWHHNCHSPPITRDLGNLQKSFTCDRCIQKVHTAQDSPINTPMSPPPPKRCSIPGCPKIPSKDPITGIMMCKNHSISEQHRLSSTSSRPRVAIKTARVNRSKFNTIHKPEDRELLENHKRRRTSTKKRLVDSTGSESTFGQSNTRLEKRKSHRTEANAFTEASPHQLGMDREYSFVHERYRSKTPPTTEPPHSNTPKAKKRSKTPRTSQTPTTEEPLSSKSPKAKKQLNKWIERHCSEDLSTSLRSWIVTQTNTNPHINNDNDWWLKLRDLFWTTKSEKLVKDAIDELNKSIRYRMQVEIRAHNHIHPTMLADTTSLLQVKQGDIERATARMEEQGKKDNNDYGDVEAQLEEWQACYHACGIIVPRDREERRAGSVESPKAPILPDDHLIAGNEDDHDDMNYEPPSPEPTMDLLDPPTTQLADITLESVQTWTDRQMHLSALASKSPVQGLAAVISNDPDDDDGLYGASPPRPSASMMSLERKADHHFPSDLEKPESNIPEAPTPEPMDIQFPEPMDTSSSTTAPLPPNSLAGTGYTWEAPKGSLEARRRVRSMHPKVIARVDKWFPPPKDTGSEKPVDTPSPVGSGSAKKKKQKKKKKSKAPITDQEFRESQLWSENIDPTKIYPRPRMTPEQLAIKRAEIKVNPPGKERKSNFGIVFTERFKAGRRARGISIYNLNIREIDDDPEVQEYTKNLENFLNIEGIDNYEPFGVKGVEGICMREMVWTKVKEVKNGRVVQRAKKESELKVVSDDRRHILFTYFRGF